MKECTFDSEGISSCTVCTAKVTKGVSDVGNYLKFDNNGYNVIKTFTKYNDAVKELNA